MSTYLTYEEKDGMSTISASPKNKNTEYIGNIGDYIFWDFEDNEIMNLSIKDGGVSHVAKRVISTGFSTSKIKDYKHMKPDGEIAFYRRHRNHERIEKEKYGGKVIPDAIIGDPTNPETIKIAQTRFGISIPIISGRGELQNEEKIYKIQKAIGEANELIKKEKQDEFNQNRMIEFEKEIGLSVEELYRYGFNEEEINRMSAKYNTKTGEIIDRQKVVEEALKSRNINIGVTKLEKKALENEKSDLER